jgi:chemotaxis signal transduction protein/predicted nucleic-acid-binding Zn-ribbon protein
MEYSTLLNNIAGVQKYNTNLIRLSERWDMLTLLGQMSNIGMDMTDTKDAFQQLTTELMQKLTDETVKKTTEKFSSIAQVAVDIVIRNLFERTADIGFLATDDDIRAYIQFVRSYKPGVPEEVQTLQTKRTQLTQRFREYVEKYSVYSDIVLFDTNGKVLAKLDSANPIKYSADPLIDEAIHTSAEYVEVYRHSDICKQQEKSLIYAYRVTQSNETDSDVLGVLCLIFRFENEMEEIFGNLKSEEDWFEITLLDRDGYVIASSDKYHIPIGAKMDMELHNEYKIIRFAGREYVVKSCATNGYQGFYGLGWYGHVMAPIDRAFESDTQSGSLVDEVILESVMESSSLFPKELKTIPLKAERIQKELNTTVWNGNVQIANTKTGDNTFSKSLLNEISTTGDGTKKIFEESIANLNATVIGSMLDNVQFQAALAIDIMDRNLYERANDCRWWALTSYFIETMEEEISDAQQKKMCDILAYINNLYTVYTNLFIYDANGIIVAVSNNSERNLIGQRIADSWVDETLKITDPQRYAVSSFEKSPFYGNRSTYIYGAPILSRHEHAKALGGIGIVFDSEPQFKSMLHDALPKNKEGNVLNGCFSLFLNRNGQVVSSSTPEFQPGDTLTISSEFFTQENGTGHSNIIEFNQKYYVVGSMVSQGYREYKRQDGYVEEIIALVMIYIGDINNQSHEAGQIKRAYAYPRPQGSEPAYELSTFYIADRLYAFYSKDVICSLTGQQVTTILGSNDQFLGVITYMSSTIPVVSLHTLIDPEDKKPYDYENDTIIIVRNGKGVLGLTVDTVQDSPSIPERCIRSSEGLGVNVITGAIVRPDPSETRKEMLSVINVASLFGLVNMDEQTNPLLEDKGDL